MLERRSLSIPLRALQHPEELMRFGEATAGGIISRLAEKFFAGAAGRTLDKSARVSRGKFVVVFKYRDQYRGTILRLEEPAPQPKLQIRGKSGDSAKRHDKDVGVRGVDCNRPRKRRVEQIDIPELRPAIFTQPHFLRDAARDERSPRRGEMIVMQDDDADGRLF